MTLDFSIFQRGREQRPQAAAQAHAEVMAQGADCLRCPLYGLARGPVRAELKPNSTLTIVGEAPGGNEVDERKPFVGKSGRILNEALAEGGLDRSQDVTITNAIACWPPDTNLEAYLLGLKRDHEREAKKAEREGREVPKLVTPLDACAKRLAHDLALANSKTVCAVGGTALAALAKHYGVAFGSQRVRSGDVRVAKVSKQRGAPVLLPNGVTLLASYHPAFAMRGKPEFMPVIKADIAKAARIAKRGGKLDWHEPEFLLDPSPDVIVNVLERMRLWSISTGQPVTIDIETDSKYPHKARLRCIGLGAVIDGAEIVICVPFRHMDGRDWWARDADKLRVANAVRSLLDDAHLAGQNLAYDTTVLLRTTLFGKRDKAWLDTMIAHHDSDHSELPHDLGFIAAQYLEAPRWKEDADSKEIENVDDRVLHRYNGLDVLNTMRLLPLVYQRTVNTSQTGALNTDTALAPIARDMGDLGLIYDHEERLHHYRAQRDKAAKELALIRSVVGSADFNPGSMRQLREWLYADLKLTPPFATDGTPWDEVEEDEEGTHLQDPSTNEAAVQALLNAGVPENIERSLESLLRWRAAEKLRGTYICLRDVKDASDAKRAKAAGRRLYQVDGRALVDTSQVSWDPTPLGEMPILHPTFKIHVVPTGRFSATPNVMAWPERPVNMRSMIQAAPGHRFVGADLDQIELRLVVLFSGDALLWDAIRKKMDVHCLNYASMEAPRAGVPISTIYEQLIAMGGKKNPKVAHMRNIAKRFCIAQGELVLTDRGLVPIERVAPTDKVWDGVEWVPHDGVVYQGEKEVIDYDGLRATGDHEVWLEDGRKVLFADAVAKHYRLARAGPDCPKQKKALVRKRAPVYDILNAGPRRRFTVSGRLVSNCYLVFYGGEVDRLYQTMSTERTPDGALAFPGLKYDDVKIWYEAWHKFHPETRAWQDRVVQGWRRFGFISSAIDGRKRYFIGGEDRNAMINMPVQSSAASIMNRAFLQIARACPHRGWSWFSGPILQVHDCAIVQVPTERADEAERLIVESMTTELDGMPITCESKQGDRWSKL